LVTEVRLRRKRIQKEDKIKRWKRALSLTEEYKKVYDSWATKKRLAAHEVKAQRKLSKESKDSPVAKQPEPKKEQPKKVEKA